MFNVLCVSSGHCSTYGREIYGDGCGPGEIISSFRPRDMVAGIGPREIIFGYEPRDIGVGCGPGDMFIEHHG